MNKNKEIVETIKYYQEAGIGHPLTCGNNTKHALLEPVVEDGVVLLKCPTCGYTQGNIPKLPTIEEIQGMKHVMSDMLSKAIGVGAPVPESKTIEIEVTISFPYLVEVREDEDGLETINEAIFREVTNLQEYPEDLDHLIMSNIRKAKVKRTDELTES